MEIIGNAGEERFRFTPGDVIILKEAFRGDVNEYVGNKRVIFNSEDDEENEENEVNEENDANEANEVNIAKKIAKISDMIGFDVSLKNPDEVMTFAAYFIGNIAVFSEYPNNKLTGKRAKKLVDQIVKETFKFIMADSPQMTPENIIYPD